jgi:hypothetical protein
MTIQRIPRNPPLYKHAQFIMGYQPTLKMVLNIKISCSHQGRLNTHLEGLRFLSFKFFSWGQEGEGRGDSLF